MLFFVDPITFCFNSCQHLSIEYLCLNISIDAEPDTASHRTNENNLLKHTKETQVACRRYICPKTHFPHNLDSRAQ